jgi:osomolarity two-component system sensor histidine kinase TcsA
MANIIEEAGHILNQVINDILDYSKLMSGTFSINSDLIDVSSIITSVVRSVQITLPVGVCIEVVLAPDLPESAQSDPLRFRQVLQNIVDNAGKFTETGSILVRTSVSAEDEATYMILTEVLDTGIGVPEATARSLFKPFVQLESAIRKRYQGTGLGLSIAKSLVELMGGQIGYCPNPERQGSIFWFTARFKKITRARRVHVANAQLGSGSGVSGVMTPGAEDVDEPLKQLREMAPTKRILAAEDNVINQKVLLGMLHGFGFKDIAVASDGMQALSMLFSSPDVYDLVLMDINMPVMDGHEATAQVRDRGIQLPIIAMTAYALKGDMELCLQKGMDDYISKPVNRKLLVVKLLKWLSRPRYPPLAVSVPQKKPSQYKALSLYPREEIT